MERRSKPLQRGDNLYMGLSLGIIFPMIGFLLFYVFAFSEEMSLKHYWDSLFETAKMSAALSLSLILNLPVFFFCLWSNRYETVKGVLAATIFYGVLVILFKFT